MLNAFWNVWIGYHDATYWSISGNEFSLKMRKQRRPKTFSVVERFDVRNMIHQNLFSFNCDFRQTSEELKEMPHLSKCDQG